MSVHNAPDEDLPPPETHQHEGLLANPASDPGRQVFSVADAMEAVGQGAYQKRAIMILGLGNASDAVEVLAINYVLAVMENPVNGQRVDSDGMVSGIMAASVFAGMLLGGLLLGSLGDRFGRKPCLQFSLVVNFASALLSAFTVHIPDEWQIVWFTFFRFLAGVGVGGSVPSVFTLASEMCTASARGVYINIVAWFWMIGSLYTALTAWIVLRDTSTGGDRWPYFLLLVSIPAGVASVATTLFVHESVQYYYDRNQMDKCWTVLRSIARTNGTSASLARFRSGVCRTCDEEQDESWQGGPVQPLEMGVEPAGSAYVTWWERNTLLLALTWYMLSFGGYGVSAWISDIFKTINFENIYGTSFFYAAASFPGNLGATLLVDRVGRRKLAAGSMSLAALSAVLFAISKSPFWVVVGALLYNTFVTSSWNAVDVLSTETFPSSTRSSRLGLVSSVGRLGSVSATFLNGIFLSNGNALGVLLFAAVCMMIGALTSFHVR